MKRYLTFDPAPGCDNPEHVLNRPGHTCHTDAFGGDYETAQQAVDSVGSDLYHLFDRQTGRWYQPGAWPTV